MAYNTKAIKKDVNGHPVPQIYNPGIDDFEPLQGANGANRVLLYDANGNPLLTAANPGQVAVTNWPATQNVQLTGSSVQDSQSIPVHAGTKWELETILNAVSVPARASSPDGDVQAKNASEIWVLVNIDQQPWSLSSDWQPWGLAGTINGHTNTGFYPIRSNVANIFTLTSNPCRSLAVLPTVSNDGITYSNWQDAIAHKRVNNFRFKVINNSTATATVTVRILRIWR